MLIMLLTALVAVNAGYLILLDRKDQRFDAQVSRLLQRIQAPELAVVEHSQEDQPPDPPSTPLTDEQQAALEEIAALERNEMLAFERRLA